MQRTSFLALCFALAFSFALSAQTASDLQFRALLNIGPAGRITNGGGLDPYADPGAMVSLTVSMGRPGFGLFTTYINNRYSWNEDKVRAELPNTIADVSKSPIVDGGFVGVYGGVGLLDSRRLRFEASAGVGVLALEFPGQRFESPFSKFLLARSFLIRGQARYRVYRGLLLGLGFDHLSAKSGVGAPRYIDPIYFVAGYEF